MVSLPGTENLRVIVEGEDRAVISAFTQTKPYIEGAVEIINSVSAVSSREEEAFTRAIVKEFNRYADYITKISNDVKIKVLSITDGGKLCDYICSNSFLDFREKQSVLEAVDYTERFSKLLFLLKTENSTFKIETEIHDKVQESIDRNQREYYLIE